MLCFDNVTKTARRFGVQVHERSVESDLALLLLRDLLDSGKAPHLRLILMSATADAEAFAAYFDSSLGEVLTADFDPILCMPTFAVCIFPVCEAWNE